MTRVSEQTNQLRSNQDCRVASGLAQVAGSAFDEWLRAAGAPQAAFHRCACHCRFRWPADAKRVEARWSTGAVGRVVELTRCPACRAGCLRVLSCAHSPSASFSPSKNEASVEQTREGAVNSLAAALVKTSGGDITREEDWAPALHAARHTIEAVAEFVLSHKLPPDTSMHDVVQRLRADRSSALLDILKLDRTIEDAVQKLALLAVASSEMQVMTENLDVPPSGEGRERVIELRERASRLGIHAAEVLLDLCTLRREVLGWNIWPLTNDTGRRVPERGG